LQFTAQTKAVIRLRCMNLRPLPADPLRVLLILLIVLCYICSKRVIGVRCAQKSLYRKKDSSDLKSRRPFVFQDVQADATQFIDIRVVDLGQKPDLRWSHRIFFWQKELQFEDSTLEWTSVWTLDRYIKVPKVIVMGRRCDSWRGIGHESFRFLDNPLGERHTLDGPWYNW